MKLSHTLVAAIVFASAPAYAVVSMSNDTSLPASPDGMNLSFDSSTNLEWLDLPLTVGQSFNNISAQLGSGGTFSGFRYATTAEVTALWTNFGISPGFDPSSSNPNILNAVTFLGNTSTTPLAVSMVGLFDDAGVGTDPASVGWARAFVVPGDPRWQADIGVDLRTLTSVENGTASYLVRAVPEPCCHVVAVFTFVLICLRRNRGRRFGG